MTNETDKSVEVKKKNLLRHNEYYDMQNIFDLLYAKSVEGKTFNNLYEIITCRNNILLAYRNIKRNSGSVTAGVNKHTITYWENKDIDQFVAYIQRRFQNFHPTKPQLTDIIQQSEGYRIIIKLLHMLALTLQKLHTTSKTHSKTV